MNNTIKHFWITKRGLEDIDYEDAFSKSVSDNRIVLALADGATEASFSKDFATILVEYYVNNPTINITNNWMNPVYESFKSLIQLETLPWHAQAKLIEQGSYSTFLGVCLDIEKKELDCIAIGDSCLFIIDSNDFIPFPVNEVLDFEKRPVLIFSHEYMNRDIEKEYFQKKKTIKINSSNITILLMTDALSKWYLEAQIKGENPNDILTSLSNQEDFNNLVENLRNGNMIKNDDCTLVIVNIQLY